MTRAVTLRDIPEDEIEVLCRTCDFQIKLDRRGLIKHMSADLLLDVVVRHEAGERPCRQPFYSGPPCAVFSPQQASGASRIAALEAAENAERLRRRAAADEADRIERERFSKAEIKLTSPRNGWMHHQMVPTGSRPRYRWQPAWLDDGMTDIVGLDGDTIIGRVFQVEAALNRDAWFWIVSCPAHVRVNRPVHGSGWEASMLKAALRVEWCYDELSRARSRASCSASPSRNDSSSAPTS